MAARGLAGRRPAPVVRCSRRLGGRGSTPNKSPKIHYVPLAKCVTLVRERLMTSRRFRVMIGGRELEVDVWTNDGKRIARLVGGSLEVETEEPVFGRELRIRSSNNVTSVL